MDIDDNEKQHTAKKIRTAATPMVDVSQIPPLEENNGNNSTNLGGSPETPKNLAMTSSNSSNKTKQKNFPGPVPAPIAFSHDNPYVNHWTNTTTQHTDQLTTATQPPLSDPNTEPDTAPDLTSHGNNRANPFFTEDMCFDFDVPTPKIYNSFKDTTSRQKDPSQNLLKPTPDDITISRPHLDEEDFSDLDTTSSDPSSSNPNPNTTLSMEIETASNDTVGKDSPNKLTYSEALASPHRNRGLKFEPIDPNADNWHEITSARYTEMLRDHKAYTPFDPTIWPTDKILHAMEDQGTLLEFIEYKLSTTPTQIAIPHAINLKLIYRDTAFFRTFTRNATLQPQHQKEFSSLLNKAIDRYKKTHDVPVTTKNNRDQIFFGLRKKLIVDFITNMEFLDMDAHSITQQLHYLWGFAKINHNEKFERTRANIREVLAKLLTTLPDNPDDIPTEISELIPFQLPIADRRYTRQSVRALRKIFSFSQLPDAYFANSRTPLPEDPNKLNESTRDLFPITDPAELRDLSHYVRLLRKYYTFEKVPPTYFDVPEPKPPLPATPQALDSEIAHLFPFLPKDASDFRRHIDILRDYYTFKRIPNDYIRTRRKLPDTPSSLKLRNTFTFPINNQQILQEFLAEVAQNYFIPEPLPATYTNLNHTNKPELPWDFRKLNNVEIKLPITNPKDLVIAARRLRKFYFFRAIPDSWINIPKRPKPSEQKPNLPNTLEEIVKVLPDHFPENTPVLPITKYEDFIPIVDTLRTKFSFTNIPNYIIALTDLPEPEWEIFDYEN